MSGASGGGTEERSDDSAVGCWRSGGGCTGGTPPCLRKNFWDNFEPVNRWHCGFSSFRCAIRALSSRN
jgi:hypothetical protein